MNVIFLDFDGVIDTYYYKSNEQVDKKLEIIASIARTYDCKIVIEASAKDAMNEDTLEIEGEWVKHIVDTLNKYGVEVIGRTPNVKKRYNSYSYMEMWKEDEIRLYLMRHPEIDHFCVIDDDDLEIYNNSDLNKIRDYLVKTEEYNKDNHEMEGILPEHKEEVGKVLKLENKYKKYALEYRRRHN